MKSLSYYFHVKTKILADFQICISVPLIINSFLANATILYPPENTRNRFLVFLGGDIKLERWSEIGYVGLGFLLNMKLEY